MALLVGRSAVAAATIARVGVRSLLKAFFFALRLTFVTCFMFPCFFVLLNRRCGTSFFPTILSSGPTLYYAPFAKRMPTNSRLQARRPIDCVTHLPSNSHGL